MMSNLLKRSFTSIILLMIVYVAIISQIFLLIFLILIGYLILVELFNLQKKILNGNNKRTVIFYLISIIYISIFFSQLYFFIIFDFENKLLILFLLSICIATDVGGFVFGKVFKGKKLTKISPKKTYSGLLGSYLFSIIVFLFFKQNFNFSFNFIILTFLISTISQLGDLFISLLKRRAKVKDTGKLLPGHGGILDRVDGIIFALPVGINLLLFLK